MSHTNEKYLFTVSTDKYAGNFEREMCGYLTGNFGECYVGSGEASLFKLKESDEMSTWFDDNVAHVEGDQGCYRPVALGNDTNSFVIYFNCQPPTEMISVMKRRAKDYIENFVPNKKIKILGFSLHREKTTIEDIDIE